MKCYSVHYKEHKFGETLFICVLARTSQEAYEKAMDLLEWKVYSAWVDNYTAQNGNVHYFNNFEGKPY